MQPGRTLPNEDLAAVKQYRTIAELIPARWTEGEVTANGARQHYYRTGGAKPALVLLHGILAGGITWLRVANALEADYDVILPDARGHGGSDGIASGISYELLVEDVAALIRALGLGRPAVLGHSMGGVTAGALAAARPELVRAVVLEDAVWGETGRLAQIGESQGYRAWLATYTAYLEGLRMQTREQRLLAALPFLPPGPTGLWPEDEYVPWVEAQSQVDLELVRRGPSLWSTLRPTTPLADLASRIACPMLLLTGSPTRGSNVWPADVAAVLERAPAARHVVFEQSGHLIHLDELDRYLAVVAAFLSDSAAA